MNTTTKPNTKHDALERIRAGVQDLLSSEGWRKALAFKRRFTRYSLLNTLLIQSQQPEATMVAGYKKWIELGRQVQKGESSIKILAPITRRDAASDEQRVIGFRFASVFDVSQTDGEPIPDLMRPQHLQGDSDRIRDLTQRLEAYAQRSGVTLDSADHLGGANGTYNPSSRTITLLNSLPPLQRLKTLAHELAHHELQHDTNGDTRARAIAELEAESAAYLLLSEHDLDTGDYSFAYLAHWNPTGEELDDLIKAGDRAARMIRDLNAALNPANNTPAPASNYPLAA